MANKANLANAIIGSAVATGDTSITLQAGYGSTMPAVPFYATITPFGQLSTKGNSEIVSVTAVSGNTMTVTRAQKGTTAKAFAAGDVFSNGIYVEDIPTSVLALSGGTTAGVLQTTAAGVISAGTVSSQSVDFTTGRKVRSCSSASPGSAIVKNAYQYDHIDFTFFVPNFGGTTWVKLKEANCGAYDHWIRYAGLNNGNPIHTEQHIPAGDLVVAWFSLDGHCGAGYMKFSVHYIGGSPNSRAYGAIWQTYVDGSPTYLSGSTVFTVASDDLDLEPFTDNAWSGTIDPISV